MISRWLLSLSMVLVLAAARQADAACSIDRLTPAGTLTRVAFGQTFSFVATNDCTTLSFATDRGALTRTPTTGAAVGMGAHWYTVRLTPLEMQSLTGPRVTSFTWSAMGWGATPTDIDRSSITNQLDLDRDGWTRTAGDAGTCDASPTQNPGLPEICGNDADENCDRTVDECTFDLDAPDAVVEGSIARSFSASTLAIADVDGDGVADLVNGAPNRSEEGRVYVSFGPVTGTVAAGDDVTITPMRGQPIGDWLAAGDADGDGYGDVLLGSWERAKYGQAHLVLGPITGDLSLSGSSALVLHASPSDHLSYHMEIAPDLDGDSAPDIVITAPWNNDWDGALYVVPGTSTGLQQPEDVATYIFRGDESGADGLLGISAIVLEDTDGDGVDEIAMNGERVHVVPGALASGDYDVDVLSVATIQLDSDTYVGTFDLAYLASLDSNDDGYGDLLVGDPYANLGDAVGVTRLFEGPLSGDIDPEDDAVATWEGDQVGSLVAAGNCNWDSAADFLLGGDGEVHLALGPAAGVVEVDALPVFPTGWTSPQGALLFVPDWSGDGIPEVVVGVPSIDTSTGSANVYYSDRFQ